MPSKLISPRFLITLFFHILHNHPNGVFPRDFSLKILYIYLYPGQVITTQATKHLIMQYLPDPFIQVLYH
jgi:hypothetical protein